MRPRFNKNETGVSEIIGALMLTLVVVIAATSYALFVSQKQKEIQKQQLDQLKRSGEKIVILGLLPTPDAPPTKWTELNVTIASLHSDTSVISSLSFNDLRVKSGKYWFFNRTSDKYEQVIYTYTDSIQLLGMDRISFIMDPSVDLFDGGGGTVITITDYVKVDVFTQYQNDFKETFLPPTAIITIVTESQWDSATSTYKDVLILDGSRSDQPGNGTIIKWSWHILGDDDSDGTFGEIGEEDFDQTGRKVAAGFTVTGIDHQITLTVQDDNGMLGIATLKYNY